MSKNKWILACGFQKIDLIKSLSRAVRNDKIEVT